MNRRVVLTEHVVGMAQHRHFSVEECPSVWPATGELLIQIDTLSVDAFIRTTLNFEAGLHPHVPIGGTVVALGVGRVLVSHSPKFAEGDMVCGQLGAQSHATLRPDNLIKLDISAPLPPSAFLGTLGLTTGITAYFGLKEVGKVEKGDVVLVSAAAGAVGLCAAQIARLLGAAKVIGIAGGPIKTTFLLNTLGLDGAIDYLNEDVGRRIKQLAPHGVDVYYDNVGGEMLDAALDNIRQGGRVVICGAISQYNNHSNTDARGPRLYLRLAERNARMEGFTVTRFAARLPEALEHLSQWSAQGKLILPEQVYDGIDAFPEALCSLMRGGNLGKVMVRVDKR